MHIQDPEQKAWLQKRIEGAPWAAAIDAATKRTILRQLTEAEGFEAFCQKRYVGTKRFGLEGGEVTIPALHAMIETAAAGRGDEVAIGMPHRGRLNTLVNVVRKPFTALFSEFGGASSKPDDVQGSGDVKYHLGTSTDIEAGGHSVHISLQPNPSHLEAVDPVVVGKVRARQDAAGDTKARRSVMGILMHGDAAFAGPGPGVRDAGDEPAHRLPHRRHHPPRGEQPDRLHHRAGARLFRAVLHRRRQVDAVPDPARERRRAGGGDLLPPAWPPSSARSSRTDFVLDIVCYRRHGHNETDEPAFTQPIMYRAIKARRRPRTLYARRWRERGVPRRRTRRRCGTASRRSWRRHTRRAKSYRPNKADWLEGRWSGLKQPSEGDGRAEEDTAVPAATLRRIGAALASVPDGFDVNPKIARQLEAKRAMLDSGEGIDWATGEALAFGALLLEGNRVRLSGEDCQRGTFSQRHAVLIDQTNQNEYVPLNNIAARRARRASRSTTRCCPRPGVLGFEYGYTLADPTTLVLWEAQFGDFANGAQVIIDQFLASGETKWLRMSGLTLLLPHGHEGQGPEHSSARLERYLQLCAERNMTCANITTPANYFHALRRQLKRNFRKPLVIMTPKSLLRHKLAVSPLAELAPGQPFRTVIGETDAIAPAEQVRRVVLCTGKVYYDLLAGAPGQRRRRRGDRAAGADLPVPGRAAVRRCCGPTPRRSWCGARRSPRTWAPGRSSTAHRGGAGAARRHGAASGYVGPRRGGEPGDRAGQGACGAAGRAGARRWAGMSRRARSPV